MENYGRLSPRDTDQKIMRLDEEGPFIFVGKSVFLFLLLDLAVLLP